MDSHQSPVKQIKTVASSFNGGAASMDVSPMLPWTSSPLYQFECFSPGEGSNMSFTMTSPPCHIPTYGLDSAPHTESMTAFSPSIFSPKDTKIASRLPKKRELYRDPGSSSSSSQVRGGIADVGMKDSPMSQSGSQGSMDLPGALALLESPHYSLWSSVQSSVGRNGADRYAPPTPTSLLGGLSGTLTEERHRLWGQSSSTDAQLLSATSQVMQMSSSPLLDGEFLLQGNRKVGRTRKLGRRSPAEDIMEADDSNDTYDGKYGGAAQRDMKSAIMQSMSSDGGAGMTATGRGAGRKKKFVSPDSSVEVNSVSELLSLSGGSTSGRGPVLSPTGTSSSVEKLSLSVKNQKLGTASGQKVSLGTAPAAQGAAGTSRRLKSQPSQLENYDLSQYFGGKSGVEDGQGDDSHNGESAAKDKVAATVTPSTGITRSETTTTTVCNCKKSKCLKLYCDCFAVMNYCSGGCNCFDCCNRTEREAIRQDAIKCTKERNALAFQTKIGGKDQHLTGCHCKNSQCLKKYCECYTGGAFCGTNCKCQMCLNFNGSADLIKARSSARDSDSSRKRKESPSSIAFLENTTPPGSSGTKSASLGAGSAIAPGQDGAQNITFSPELRASLGLVNSAGAGSKAASSGVAGQTGVAPVAGRGPSTRGGTLLATPAGSSKGAVVAQAQLATPTPIPTYAGVNSIPAYAVPELPMATVVGSVRQATKRSRTQPTPVPMDRQLRSRRLSGDSEEGTHNSATAALALASATKSNATRSNASSSAVPAPASAGKKRQVKFAPIPIVYPFFGAHLPPTSKLIALKCLDFLEGKDIYAMSQVNTLWNAAAMDDALWE